MANMFSEYREKTVPKTLSECIQPSPTVNNLHTWAERLENWGQGLFIVLIIIGIISTIVTTVQANEINGGAAFAACITSIITWGLYAFIEYCAYHVLALLISALAFITQNTAISANVALLNAQEKHPLNEKASATNKITRKNSEQSKMPDISPAAPSDDPATPTQETTIKAKGTLLCPKCGKSQFAGAKKCFSCGTIFDQSDSL